MDHRQSPVRRRLHPPLNELLCPAHPPLPVLDRGAEPPDPTALTLKAARHLLPLLISVGIRVDPDDAQGPVPQILRELHEALVLAAVASVLVLVDLQKQDKVAKVGEEVGPFA